MKKTILRLLALPLLLLGADRAAAQHQVDFRYAPQWHASAISFPDDTCKTLVGPQGQLLYDFGSKDFFPFANDRGFQTVIHVLADEGILFKKQRLENSRFPVVVTEGSYDELTIVQKAMALALDYTRRGTSTRQGNREDLVWTAISNPSGVTRRVNPTIVINSSHRVAVNGNEVTFTDTLNRSAHLLLSGRVERMRQNLAEGTRKTVIELAAIEVPAGETRAFLAMYDNGKQSDLATAMRANSGNILRQWPTLYDEASRYWLQQTDIPYDHVLVPDSNIQHLVDASLRGIWQARELKHDSIAFQVGPTCYRGLWIVDGAFLLETATMMDRGPDARQGIEYMLSFQQPNGGIRKMSDDYWKENGIVLWTCVRHAFLTQDKTWLRAKWPQLVRVVDFIRQLRQETYRNNIPLDDGLQPPGEIDGGLWGAKDKAEYSNVYWNLAGLKAMLQAAQWLGDKKTAATWQKEYDDFYQRFQLAAQRDLASDAFGNRYLNIIMDPALRSLPQRAQWTFCHAVYPGQLFAQNDPLLSGTMKMLDATLQEGMVMGTGWQIDGIWNYFASFYGHASLWLGEKEKAIASLYAFANHASPLFAWREEHNPRDLQPKYVGDMPHNWASAEFVRLVVHLLAIDRDRQLHLFEGMPAEWLQPGMETRLHDVNTVFGKLTFRLRVDQTGDKATLEVDPLGGTSCEGLYVHLGKNGPVRLDPSKKNNLVLSLH